MRHSLQLDTNKSAREYSAAWELFELRGLHLTGLTNALFQLEQCVCCNTTTPRALLPITWTWPILKAGLVIVQGKAAAAADQLGAPTPQAVSQAVPKAMPLPTATPKPESEGDIVAVLAEKRQQLELMADMAGIQDDTHCRLVRQLAMLEGQVLHPLPPPPPPSLPSLLLLAPMGRRCTPKPSGGVTNSCLQPLYTPLHYMHSPGQSKCISYRIVSYHIMSYHIISYHIIL